MQAHGLWSAGQQIIDMTAEQLKLCLQQCV